ncbi:MAG: bacterial Ig-like domain-containing protein [bacterium]|nr:bacterial Ig-like domain-containing protein [bacterium]
MKNKTLIITLFLFLFGFCFLTNVSAEKVDPPTLDSVTRYTSTSVSIKYDLSSCPLNQCGIMVMNENWFKEKRDGSIVLRSKNDKEYIWQNLEKGTTYNFLVAVYWFDEDGILKNGVWSDKKSVEVGTPTDKVATDMVITTGPTKTVYNAGEAFDPKGMKINIIYNNGTNAEIMDGAGCTFTPSVLTSGTTTVKVTCEGQSANQSVTVNGNATGDRILVLQKSASPTKTTYNAGETFDPSGMKLNAEYENGTSAVLDVKSEVASGKCSFSPSGALTKNDTKVTITCGDATVSQDITVKDSANKTISSINSVVSNPTKTTYTEGETFDPSGMRINVTYDDGTTDVINVTSSICTFTPSVITSDTTKVTVKCGNAIKDVSITVGVCTPDTPTISKTLASSSTWANGLYASGGNNCGSGTTYKWSTSSSFSSSVSGMSYTTEVNSGTTIYLTACYKDKCSEIPARITTGIDMNKPSCTMAYYKMIDTGNQVVTQDYTCDKWTKGSVFAQIQCSDPGVIYSGLKQITWKVTNLSTNITNEVFNKEFSDSPSSTNVNLSPNLFSWSTGKWDANGSVTDNAGNELKVNTCKIKIDRDAPVGGSATADNSTKGKLVWNLTAMSDPDSGIRDYKLEYREAGDTAWTVVGINNTENPFVQETVGGAVTSYPAVEVSRSCDTQVAYYEWKVTRTDIAGNSTTSDVFKKYCPTK